MNYIDFLILIFIALGFLLGFKDGLVRKLIGLIGFIIAIAAAFQYSSAFGKLITPLINNEYYLAELIAGMLIFLIGILITSIIKRIIHPVDKVNKFLNQMLGGLAGGIQMCFFISIALLLLNIFHIPKSESKNSSLFYNKAYNLVPATVQLFLGDQAKVKNFFIKFIESKDSFNSTINN